MSDSRGLHGRNRHAKKCVTKIPHAPLAPISHALTPYRFEKFARDVLNTNLGRFERNRDRGRGFSRCAFVDISRLARLGRLRGRRLRIASRLLQLAHRVLIRVRRAPAGRVNSTLMMFPACLSNPAARINRTTSRNSPRVYRRVHTLKNPIAYSTVPTSVTPRPPIVDQMSGRGTMPWKPQTDR
ncbi:MAG: hypothetical protein R3B46_14070 [Phycisphaerales bacterium]